MSLAVNPETTPINASDLPAVARSAEVPIAELPYEIASQVIAGESVFGESLLEALNRARADTETRRRAITLAYLTGRIIQAASDRRLLTDLFPAQDENATS